jgi:hypothetical protein
MDELTNEELLYIIKSVGKSTDVDANKLERFDPQSRMYRVTAAELTLGRTLKHKLDVEHSRRIGIAS